MHLTSIISMSFNLRPVLSNNFLMAGAGPIPMMDGSTPATL